MSVCREASACGMSMPAISLPWSPTQARTGVTLGWQIEAMSMASAQTSAHIAGENPWRHCAE